MDQKFPTLPVATLASFLAVSSPQVSAMDPVRTILDARNRTVERFERTCSVPELRNACHSLELRRLFDELAGSDPAAVSLDAETAESHRLDLDRRLRSECVSRTCDLSRPQIVSYVDVGKNGQILSVWFHDPSRPAERYVLIGASRVSTGYPDPKPRNPPTETKFATGTGVFTTDPNATGVIGYRAEGTKNSKGIRGFGERGNRVYDVGPMKTKRAWDGSDMTIRFMIHSTDPVLESKFGERASQGCLRIPKTVNRFFEFSGAFDAGYAPVIQSKTRTAIGRAAAGLLGADARFHPFSGSLLVIGNSDDSAPAATVASSR